MIPKIALVGLAGELEVGFAQTPEILEKAASNLFKNRFDVIKTDVIMYNGKTVAKAVDCLKNQDFDLFCICVGTWSEDHHLIDLLEHYDKPVVLWAFPAVDTGSLCGVQQICCVLKELGRRYFYFYGEPDDNTVADEIGVFSKAVALVNTLKLIKIGSIGGRVKGMTEVAFDEFEIKYRTGVRIVNLDDDDLIAEYEKIDESDALKLWNDLKSKVARITANDRDGIDAMKYYQAMKGLVSEWDLKGLAVKCYPRYMGKICLGYSLLSEEGIVCGCEGDVNNTVAMRILYELTGKPVHNTDLLYTQKDLNTILFSHCGSGGFSIANQKGNIHLGAVRLANTGVCSLFPAKPGKVTLINLVGRKETLRMSVLVGDAIECEMEFPGNPLKVRFKRDILDINRQIAIDGIGHHWMGGYGDVSSELEYFCDLKGIRLIKL